MTTAATYQLFILHVFKVKSSPQKIKVKFKKKSTASAPSMSYMYLNSLSSSSFSLAVKQKSFQPQAPQNPAATNLLHAPS